MTSKPPYARSGRSAPRIGRRAVVLAAVAGLAGVRTVGAADAPAAVPLPDSVTLQYAVNARYRGLPLQSDATLLWQRDAQRYHAEWRVRVPFLGERTQRSDGEITPAGIRPSEYVEETNKLRSARFDHAEQRIHFSDGRANEVLQPGAQDRLTVSLQLGALLAADPGRGAVGNSLSLPVVGVRGAETWHWDVLAQEDISVAGRPLAALKLARRARKEPDSQITLWLAPGMHYLPVRMRVVQENGDSVDQQLSQEPAR